MFVRVIKYLLVFIGGLVAGGFGYEILMKDVHEQRIVGILTEFELNQVENFLKFEKVDFKTWYCFEYGSARYNVEILEEKIEAAQSGKFHNGFLLSNMGIVSEPINKLHALEEAGLRFDCENS